MNLLLESFTHWANFGKKHGWQQEKESLPQEREICEDFV